MRYTEYHAGKAVIKDKSLLSEAMEKLARYEDAEEKDRLGQWIPCSEKLPEDESYILVSFENATIQISQDMKKMMKAVHSIREMMKNHIQAMKYLSMHGHHCRSHTGRNNEDNNIHHHRLYALRCLELMHCRSKCR